MLGGARSAFAAFLFTVLGGGTAHADPADRPQTQGLSERPHRRSGVELGLMLGAGIAGSAGYPNNATKIGDPNYYSASGLMAGSAVTVLVMGALADALSFGFWFGTGTFQNRDWRSTGGGGGFRLEVFPLYSIVPSLKDLGIAAQFGIGTTSLDAKFAPNVSSDGTSSFLGVGSFYEWSIARFFGGHAVIGPSVEYDVITSRPVERHGATAALRVVFYGGL